jgi:lactoylglutathione lyase
MVRISNIEESLNFYCNLLEMVEVNRVENEQGKFTLIFLAAKNDKKNAKETKSPLLELTYNWPVKENEDLSYSTGRNFGHLAYRVENIYETCQRVIDQGYVLNRPPRDGYMAFIKSPDGISVELLQAGEALPAKAPWKTMENIGTW